MDHLEEIKSRLNIEELVGGYIQLKKAGRNLKGLCPFHHEKSPSFMVSPDKGIAYCFGCQKGGDIFKFLQLVENLDFPEAVKRLADKTGVRLPNFNPAAQNKRLRTIEINEVATVFYAQQLDLHPQQKDYFLKRGLTEETMRRFRLGYAPDSFHALKDHLQSAGFSESEMLEAGVLNQRSMADKSSYDRFRGRLIFPIMDSQGEVVGFGGRIIDEGEPKYLNSPETPSYSKSLVLYGLNYAKDAIKQADMAIFVEGYMDVITAHQANCKNVVATSGTAMTPQQLKLIKRYTSNIAFAFDQDSAGLEAARRAIELAQTAELDPKVIMTPKGKDPDECIRTAPDDWFRAVAAPVTAMDFYLSYALRQWDKADLSGQKNILGFLMPLLRQIKTQVEQGHYLEKIARELKTDIRYLWEDLKKNGSQPAKRYSDVKSAGQDGSVNLLTKIVSREEYLLGFILEHPKLYPYVHENTLEGIALEPSTERFYKALKTIYNRESELTVEGVKEALPPEDHSHIDLYQLLIEEHYPDFSEEAASQEVVRLVDSINRKNLKAVQKQYEFRLREIADPGERSLLLNQYNELLKLSSKI